MRGRQKTTALSRDLVVATALDIVDRDGINGLTMRALGLELGVDPMAAYYHVPNKAAVLDGVVEAVWAELDLPDPSDEPWQSQLTEVARSMREVLVRHPNALPIMVTRPNLSAPGFQITDRTLGILLDAGFPPDEALEFVNAAAEFIVGHAMAETSQPVAGDTSGDDRLVDALGTAGESGEFPHLTQVLGEVALEEVTMDRIFEAGLAVLVSGLEQRLGN